jgi:hypothetical protein
LLLLLLSSSSSSSSPSSLSTLSWWLTLPCDQIFQCRNQNSYFHSGGPAWKFPRGDQQFWWRYTAVFLKASGKLQDHTPNKMTTASFLMFHSSLLIYAV